MRRKRPNLYHQIDYCQQKIDAVLEELQSESVDNLAELRYDLDYWENKMREYMALG